MLTVTIPVMAGFVAGVAFLLIFSNLADSLPATRDVQATPYTFVIMSVNDLKQTYLTDEPVSFTLTAKGLSTGICNHPKPLITIVNIDKGERVWTTPPSAQTSMLCGTEPFYKEWRFGYEGEELPFQSALVHDRYYENRIAMEEAGTTSWLQGLRTAA